MNIYDYEAKRVISIVFFIFLVTFTSILRASEATQCKESTSDVFDIFCEQTARHTALEIDWEVFNTASLAKDGFVTKKDAKETLPILEVRDLHTYFYTADGVVKAVDGVNLDVFPQRTLGIVGESGCGKSITTKSILRLIDNPGKILDGTMTLYDKDHENPQDIATLNNTELKKVRGGRISMIFQEPMTSFSPIHTIGNQITEAITLHLDHTKEEAMELAEDWLVRVGMSNPKQRLKQYAFELSGGQRQRAMIAMALCTNPDILIADEPTTALDVTTQAQTLDLLNELQEKNGMSIIMITHDLGVIAELADEVNVMYLGKVIESGSIRQVFKTPKHPYTLGF